MNRPVKKAQKKPHAACGITSSTEYFLLHFRVGCSRACRSWHRARHRGYITGYHRDTHNCSHLHIRTTNYPDMHVWTVGWMWTIPGPSCCEAIVLTTTPRYRVVFIVSINSNLYSAAKAKKQCDWLGWKLHLKSCLKDFRENMNTLKYIYG